MAQERLLILLNEDPPGSHADVRYALAAMVDLGVLADHAIVPFRARMAAGAAPREVADEILATAGQLQPTQVLFSHTSGMRLPDDVVPSLRAMPGLPALGYWEGDWYDWLSKPVPSEIRDLAAACDVAFVCGQGQVTSSFARAGCPRLEYVPLVADERFAEPASPVSSVDFDLVMVGNRHVRRNPIRTMQGALERQALVRLFERRLGTRFAVFGAGWSGPSAQGTIPYTEQGDAYRRAAVVLGNNDLHAAYYFSNRLPVAMMSSVPIVHGFERGLDVVVPGWLGVSWFSSTSEAWDAFNRAAETPPDAGTREAAREFARDRLSTRAALSYMSQVLAAVRESRLTGGPAQPVPNLWGVDLARRSDS